MSSLYTAIGRKFIYKGFYWKKRNGDGGIKYLIIKGVVEIYKIIFYKNIVY